MQEPQYWAFLDKSQETPCLECAGGGDQELDGLGGHSLRIGRGGSVWQPKDV